MQLRCIDKQVYFSKDLFLLVLRIFFWGWLKLKLHEVIGDRCDVLQLPEVAGVFNCCDSCCDSLSSCVGGPELASTGGLVSVVSPPPQVTVRDVRVRGCSVSEWL